MAVGSPPALQRGADAVAAQLRSLRRGTGMTLKDVGAATGLSVSQISKLETGQARLTVDLALRFAGALGVPANAFFLGDGVGQPDEAPVLTRAGSGVRHSHKGLDFEVLGSGKRVKRALTWRVTVHGTSLEGCGGYRTHAGEEFLQVLSGVVTLYFERWPTATLNAGDSIVFDGETPHGYAALEGPAVALMSNSVAP